MHQNISSYMINLGTKKWWWLLFRFCLDVSVNNAFQICRERHLQPGGIKIDLIGFRRSIVEIYFLLFHNKEAPSTLYRGNRSSEKLLELIKTDKKQYWIVKGNQRRRAMRGCSGTSRYSCKKCNVGLHPECFKRYHV